MPGVRFEKSTMYFVLMGLAIRRQEKECDSGALKSLLSYNNLEKGTRTALHGGSWAEAGGFRRDVWANA